MVLRSAAHLVIAALGPLLEACAGPGQLVTQTLRVETPGCAQVACELSNDRGRWILSPTPGNVTLTTSHAPLKVRCRAEDDVGGGAATPSSLASTTGAGAVTGGIVGGAAVGAAVGLAALMFNPVAGVVAVLGGVAMGAFAGQAAESGQQSIRYPELISIPMNCAPLTAVAPGGGETFGLAIRGLPPELARAAGLGAQGVVLVTAVAAGGRAEAAGLRSGDIILAAGGRALGDAADLQEWLLAMVSDVPLALRVWRDGQMLELVLSRAAAVQR